MSSTGFCTGSPARIRQHGFRHFILTVHMLDVPGYDQQDGAQQSGTPTPDIESQCGCAMTRKHALSSLHGRSTEARLGTTQPQGTSLQSQAQCASNAINLLISLSGQGRSEGHSDFTATGTAWGQVSRWGSNTSHGPPTMRVVSYGHTAAWSCSNPPASLGDQLLMYP